VGRLRKDGREEREAVGRDLGEDAGQRSTILNKPYRSISTVLGSEDMATFNSATPVGTERVCADHQQSGLFGTMSDSARKEAETLLSPDATVKQIRAAIAALQAEAGEPARELSGPTR